MDRNDIPIGQPLPGGVDLQPPVAELVQPGPGRRPHRALAGEVQGERLLAGHSLDARAGGHRLVADREEPVAGADPDPTPAVLAQRQDLGLHQSILRPIDPHGPAVPSGQALAPGADPQAAVAALEDGVDRVGGAIGAAGDRQESPVMQPVEIAGGRADPQVAGAVAGDGRDGSRWNGSRCGTGPDRAAVEAIQPGPGADPEDPVAVLMQRRDLVVAQPLGGRVMMPSAPGLHPQSSAGADPEPAASAGQHRADLPVPGIGRARVEIARGAGEADAIEPEEALVPRAEPEEAIAGLGEELDLDRGQAVLDPPGPHADRPGRRAGGVAERGITVAEDSKQQESHSRPVHAVTRRLALCRSRSLNGYPSGRVDVEIAHYGA